MNKFIEVNKNTFLNVTLSEATKTAELLGADRSFLLESPSGYKLVFFTPSGDEVLNITITGMFKRLVSIFPKGRVWGIETMKKLKKERILKRTFKHLNVSVLPYSIN